MTEQYTNAQHTTNDDYSLEALGFGPFFEQQRDALDAIHRDHIPARICADYGTEYGVLTPDGAGRAVLLGEMLHSAQNDLERPAVGDWVMLVRHDGLCSVSHVFERTSKLVRQAAGRRTASQVVGANLDTVFIVTSANQDMNPRRIERYLTTVWESGAAPVIVISKADLCDDIDARVERLEAISMGVPVEAISALSEGGLDALTPHLEAGKTVALLGASGVGKSTIVNGLAGAPLQTVKAIRKDAFRGKHTTTHRELFVLPGRRGMLVDTPGIRELQLWSHEGGEGASSAFEDVEALIDLCKFRNCQHSNEPGCAIQSAIAEGNLELKRWKNYLKIQRELAYQQRRQDVASTKKNDRRWGKLRKQALAAQPNKR